MCRWANVQMCKWANGGRQDKELKVGSLILVVFYFFMPFKNFTFAPSTK